MVKVWFPTQYMKLVGLHATKRPPEAVFQIAPSMTKHEVKEHLTKIYNIPVIRVNTMNYAGRTFSF